MNVNPFLSCSNVLVSPHYARWTQQCKFRKEFLCVARDGVSGLVPQRTPPAVAILEVVVSPWHGCVFLFSVRVRIPPFLISDVSLSLLDLTVSSSLHLSRRAPSQPCHANSLICERWKKKRKKSTGGGEKKREKKRWTSSTKKEGAPFFLAPPPPLTPSSRYPPQLI